jgi:hypothetical protein
LLVLVISSIAQQLLFFLEIWFILWQDVELFLWDWIWKNCSVTECGAVPVERDLKNCSVAECGDDTREYESTRVSGHAFRSSLQCLPQTWASGVVRQDRRHGPSIWYKITSCWATLLRLARRAAVLDQPSIALDLIGYYCGRGGYGKTVPVRNYGQSDQLERALGLIREVFTLPRTLSCPKVSLSHHTAEGLTLFVQQAGHHL